MKSVLKPLLFSLLSIVVVIAIFIGVLYITYLNWDYCSMYLSSGDLRENNEYGLLAYEAKKLENNSQCAISYGSNIYINKMVYGDQNYLLYGNKNVNGTIENIELDIPVNQIDISIDDVDSGSYIFEFQEIFYKPSFQSYLNKVLFMHEY